MGAFCRWHEKDMEQLTEHEQEACANITLRKKMFAQRKQWGIV